MGDSESSESSDRPPRIRAGAAAELSEDAPRLVDLAPRERGKLHRQAVVLRDATDGGRFRAYLNECQHLAIPLGGRSGRLLTEDGKFLICRTHGALYRLNDGFCTEGPCHGTHLMPLALEEDEDGVLWVIDDGADTA